MKRGRCIWMGGLVVLAGLSDGCVPSDLISGPGDVGHNDIVVSEEFTFSLDLTSQVRFRLEGVNGQVHVSGDPDVTSVTVSGRRSVGSDDSADALEHLARLRVETIEGSTEYTVRTVQPEDSGGRLYVVDYIVTVPASLIQVINNVNGDVLVEGINAAVVINDVNGNIHATGILGDLAMGAVNGNITADVTPPTHGRVDLNSVNGNISLSVPRDVSARLDASWLNGGLSLHNVTLSNSVITQKRVAGTLGEGEGEIVMIAVNGQLSLTGR